MSTYICEPGAMLGGRYRLEDRIAGTVGWSAWKATDEILARPVTVVTLAPGFPRVEDVIAAARSASRLADSRLGQVFDIEDDCARAYIVMEWAAWDTLDDLLAAGPLDPALGARIVADAAAALAVAHAAGLAHLCLTPGSLRIAQGGGIKVVGLGIDAALSGSSNCDHALADTIGLGRLLYAALTGHWPGPDYPALPPAPVTDGSPRRPRQVRAGVPAALDEVTCRALQLGGQDAGHELRRPGDLASALQAVLPPVPPPPAAAHGRATARAARTGARLSPPGSGAGHQRGNGHPDQPPPAAPRTGNPGRRRRTRGRIAVILLGALAVLAGAAAVTAPLWHAAGPRSAHHRRADGRHPPARVIVPASASGYDPLASTSADPYNENSRVAGNAIDGNPATYWTTQYYATPEFGNTKKGSGLILAMPRPITLSSIRVTFGNIPGADVKIMIGNSDARSRAALDAMTTIARADDVAGMRTFTVHSSAKGRYVLIWFTRLAPAPKQLSSDYYLAQVFNVVVRGFAG